MTALSKDWAVEVVSWLPDAEQSLGRRWLADPLCLLRTTALSVVRPVHVAYVQALAPRRLSRRLGQHIPILYMTDRSVPVSPVGPYVIDFIDDLGGAALRRAEDSQAPRSWFWRWEGRRLRRLDARLASRAVRAVAITEQDAAAIASGVGVIRAAISTEPMPASGTRVVFTGNLFYPPNLEAAMWICQDLAPELSKRGVDPARVVIAGRRPPRSLTEQASIASISLDPNVPDLTETLRGASVVLCPVTFGSGVQNKVLDAVGARRACILTPFANRPLGLVDGESALIRERSSHAFADAIMQLLGDAELSDRLASRAQEHLARYSREAVEQAWRICAEALRPSSGDLT